MLADVFNLRIRNDAINPGIQIDVRPANPNRCPAFMATLLDAFGDAVDVVSDTAYTIDSRRSGAPNSLDVGVLQPSSWYYIWIISDGTTAGLLSLSSLAPTLPSGFTYAALVGAVYCNESTQFNRFQQIDRRVYFEPVNVFTSNPGTVVWDSQFLSDIVPPIANFVRGAMGFSSANISKLIAVAGDANGTGAVTFGASVGTHSLDGFTGGAPFCVPLLTPQTLYWKADGTAAVYRIDVSGWEL
jgi:hypothetical protein